MDDSIRKELMRLCGIKQTAGLSGIKLQEQRMSGVFVPEEVLFDQEKSVCSIEERTRQDKEKQLFLQDDYAKELEEESDKKYFYSEVWKGTDLESSWSNPLKSGAESLKKGKRLYTEGQGEGEENQPIEVGNDETGHANKKSPDKIRREMIRNHVIKELVHEEGKTDPESHFKLLKRLIMHDLLKPLESLKRLLVALLLKLFGAILSALLPVILILIPVLFLIYLILSPVSFFKGLFDADDIMQDPRNIRSVVREKYVEFQGKISTFQDADTNNQVEYIYGKYTDSQIEEIMAVYLTLICTSEDYGKLDEDNGYPPYLIVDTVKEQDVLNEVFSQFNYTRTEGIIVHQMNNQGLEWDAQAEKMTVYCLTSEQWKDSYSLTISGAQEELLESMLDEVEKNVAEGEDFTSGGSIPITDIKIPEHLDENLVYMAGFLKAEAGNQSYEGKIAVAYVMLNRAGGPTGNIKGILTAPYQFSCYIPYHTVEKYLQAYADMTDEDRAMDSCWQAASAAYYGTAENPIGGMKYYCNPKYCSVGETEQWRRIRAKNSPSEILIIGDHVFCQNCW